MGDKPRERENGVLSKRDREYLYGMKDVEEKPKHERNIRKDIRERTVDSVLDFKLLFNGLEERDRKQIFDRLAEEEDDYIIEVREEVPVNPEDHKIESMVETISFITLCFLEQEEQDSDEDILKHLFEVSALKALCEDRDTNLDELDVNIEVSIKN